MTKEAALKQFFSGFGIAAYPSTAVPNDVVFPSFINETQYPELVAALGKLIPSGDKFQLISSGVVGPQITNGVVYGGRLWVYSYSTKKLYGVDLEGTAAVKEIALTSEDEHFNDYIAPSNASPLCLSVVPRKSGTGAKLFLSQIIGTGDNLSTWKNFFIIFQAEFSDSAEELALGSPFSAIVKSSTSTVSEIFGSSRSVPYIVSRISAGKEEYMCAVGYARFSNSTYGVSLLNWADGDDAANLSYEVGSSEKFSGQRYSFTVKNNEELVSISCHSYNNYGALRTEIQSYPKGTFSSNGYEDGGTYPEGRRNPLPLSVAGRDRVLASFEKNSFPWVSFEDFSSGEPTPKISPGSARIFIDAAAYLWGKDIYMIFVGTGIIFSRDLTEGSFGYLDTTSVLGAITQFGYLDYSEDEGTLYLLGQDTTNTVKVAKIVLNTLYDYANDGAWLPLIASDGVPAYIKAKGEETIVDPVNLKITLSSTSEYADVIFNGETFSVQGTYSRTVSRGGTFTIGLRRSMSVVGSGFVNLVLNGSTVVSVSLGDPVGTTKTKTFMTSDYVASGITLKAQ